MTQVSVVLPCYNASATLPETLESLISQSLVDFELVAIDDGSIDSTLDILQSWAECDHRIQVISHSHRGVIETANAGINACSGEFIARMDADDIAHPERLTQQVAFLKNYPDVAVVSCLVKAFHVEGVREGYQLYVEWLNSLLTDQDIRREIFVESPIANPSMMMRKSWLKKMDGYQEHGWPEDYDLWLRMYLAGAVFAKIPRVLLEWRDHPERITRTDSRYSITNFLKAKAYYLARGPLSDRDAIIIWGAGMMGRRLGKHLQSENVPLCAYIDIDPKKIGSTRRGKPIFAPDKLPELWHQYKNPAILAAVGARRARGLIRNRLTTLGFIEGQDWWAAA